MSGESLPSGVLKVADLLIEARIEGDSRYTLRTSAVAFAKGAEFALNIARRYLASPPPQATGALSVDEATCQRLLALGWQPVMCGVCGSEGAVALSSAKREAEPLTLTQIEVGREAFGGERFDFKAGVRFAELHHGITAASQVEPEDKHG